jgi:hypothetical protein
MAERCLEVLSTGSIGLGMILSSGITVAAMHRSAYSRPMSEHTRDENSDVVAEAVADCPRCQKPMPLCICDSVTPIESRISLLILQHPQEQDRALGTARLTAQHFEHAVVKVGLSWPSLAGACAEAKTKAGLPPAAARGPRSLEFRLVLMNHNPLRSKALQ